MMMTFRIYSYHSLVKPLNPVLLLKEKQKTKHGAIEARLTLLMGALVKNAPTAVLAPGLGGVHSSHTIG